VNPRESSGSQLRFREDITVPLTLDASKALDELKEILYSAAQEESLHLPPQSLPQGSIIMIDNRRWLHSRNEVKDPNRHLRRVR
jgi:alpha-ketoglutarate-dependent taurine dioxygenase